MSKSAIALRVQLHNVQVENRRLRRKVRQMERRGVKQGPEHRALRFGRIWILWWCKA